MLFRVCRLRGARAAIAIANMSLRALMRCIASMQRRRLGPALSPDTAKAGDNRLLEAHCHYRTVIRIIIDDLCVRRGKLRFNYLPNDGSA